MPWTKHPKVTDLRRRSRVVDVIVATADGFRRHLSGRNTAVLAYYGVLTLFPLLMAATTIMGFVLEDNPGLQEDIVDSALSQIPLIGDEIEQNAGRIDGSYWALVIGLLIALWGSLKAFVGVQIALDDIWEIDVDDRATAAIKRIRALIGIAVIGAAQVGTVVLAALVGQAGLPRLGQILITLGGLVVNITVVATMYRFLTSKTVTWKMVWPGALFTGVLYTTLQFVGANVMANTLDNAKGVYGTFAGLLALMSWLSLHALISLVGAELNSALDEPAAAPPTAAAPSPAAG
jgi:YihY family inner membrane protein